MPLTKWTGAPLHATSNPDIPSAMAIRRLKRSQTSATSRSAEDNRTARRSPKWQRGRNKDWHGKLMTETRSGEAGDWPERTCWRHFVNGRASQAFTRRQWIA